MNVTFLKIEYHMTYFKPLVFILLLFCGGCLGMIPYSGPFPSLAPKQMDFEAKQMEAPTDKALVYFYNNNGGYPTRLYINDVYLDGMFAGQFDSDDNTYFMWLLTPGKHDISLLSKRKNLIIDTKAGEIYYVASWMSRDYKRSWMAGFINKSEASGQLVDREIGRKGIQESLLLVDRALDTCGLHMALPATDEKAKTMQATEGKVLVYFYRSEGAAWCNTPTVYMNGKPLGKTAGKTYYVWLLTPGRYDFESDGSIVNLDAKAGETYYIWQHVWRSVTRSPDPTGVSFLLYQVNKEMGREGVMESNLLIGNPVDRNLVP